MLIPKPKRPEALPIKHSIAGPPTEDMLQKYLEKAYDNMGRIVEVNWTLHNPETLFQLQVTCDLQGGEPIWTLIKGPPPPPPPMPGEFRPRYIPPEPAWTHQTGYVSIIAETCIVESGGQVDENVSIAESVIGLKGAAAMPGSVANYKPMIFGVTAAAPAYQATEPQSQAPPAAAEPAQAPEPAVVQPWMPEPPRSGDLSKVAATQLVQAINAYRWTGCLHFLGEDRVQGGEIFFVAGMPVHAVASNVWADGAFIDLIAWQKGQFSFIAEEKAEQRTILGHFEALLNAGKATADQIKAIRFAGFELDSKLRRKQSLSSEAEFEQIITSRGVPVDMAKQKHLYLGADGSASTLQILQAFSAARAECIALLYNLVVCDLITG